MKNDRKWNEGKILLTDIMCFKKDCDTKETVGNFRFKLIYNYLGKKETTRNRVNNVTILHLSTGQC